jgi:hypothetical protein
LKKIRQSQLISPWGIGQIVNFPNNVSLMVAGLDEWNNVYNWASVENSLDEFVIHEERLEKQLGVKEFRLPPEYREVKNKQKNTSLTIPFVNFPLWYYCPRCGWMVKRTLYSNNENLQCKGKKYKYGLSCSNLEKKKRPQLIPVRFITVCSEGHIEDFPFYEWAHKGQECKKGFGEKALRMITGKSSSLAGISIHCECGAYNTMAGAFGNKSLEKFKKCSGSRPWLGEVNEKAKGCGKNLHVVQRGASNVYFPVVQGAIYLPKNTDQNTEKALEQVLNVYKQSGSLMEGSKWGVLKSFSYAIATERGIDPDKLYDLAYSRIFEKENKEKKIKLKKNFDTEIRLPEYKAILSGAGADNQELYVKVKKSNEYKDIVSRYFKNIGLVHKLMETRVFMGFTRLEPPDYQNRMIWRRQLSKKPVDWLPAVQVKGEGIFFEFDNNQLNRWVQNPLVQKRIEELEYNLSKSRFNDFKLNPKFVLIHTFAHLLINQLSFECGYGSSSIRERIYCSKDSADDSMNGVLIYTASNDSEGSMGGLVRQGIPGRLENVIYELLENAKWCSSDPICIQSKGQGPDSCNLAACHNCALLPETSCEFGNRILDRALIVGTDEHESVGFFSC